MGASCTPERFWFVIATYMIMLKCTLWVILLAGAAVVAQGQPRPATLPSYRFVGPDGTAITPAQLDRAKPTLVVFFDPHCDHCQRQASLMTAELPALKEVNLLWVTTSPREDLLGFATAHFPEWKKLPLLRWGLDVSYEFDKWFGYSTVPTLLVFGVDGRLRDVFTNEIAPGYLLSRLK